MIRCQLEVTDIATDKKAVESTARPHVTLRRATFAELRARDELRWRAVATPGELRCLTERVQRELFAGELPRFVEWTVEAFGYAFARAAGLPVGRPRIGLAS
ncbi:MAG: hypothetical protein IT385_05960 [Deltaproteobacteria bacterium]|nr:hypothetical protein [Deltaproteobacteria bacterium]